MPLDFCCARLAVSPALWSARASAASSAIALWPCPVQQIVQRGLSERSVRKACMALGCIALKARQGLALHRTSIVGQRLRCCRVAELENSPKAGRESLVVCGSSEALVPSVARRTLAGEERPSLCAAELTRPTRHLYLGVARQCSLGGGASREFENKHSGRPPYDLIESERSARTKCPSEGVCADPLSSVVRGPLIILRLGGHGAKIRNFKPDTLDPPFDRIGSGRSART